MSTKQTSSTQGTNNTAFQFNPQSMGAYQNFTLGQALPFLTSMFQNPYGNQMFQQENTISQDQAANLGQRNKSNILGNAAALGYSTNGGLMADMTARAGRDTSGMQAQGFRNAILNANNRAMQGSATVAGFQPLMTGSNSNYNQNSQSQTSGLGTWLPQLAGAALGAGMNFATMGASGAASSSMSGLGAGVGQTGSGMSGMMGGLGNVLGGSKGGYGYGSGGGPNVNPFMFYGGGGGV